MPTGDACELDRLTLKNKTDAIKELDVFSYVEFCLWDAIDDSSNFQRNFSTGEVEVEPAIIYHKTEYRERRNHYAVFWSNTPVTSFDTTRDAFCGVYGGPADPSAPGTAPAALPTAGHRWARCTSMSPLHRVRKRRSSSVWATSRTHRKKSSPPRASSIKHVPTP